MEKMLFTHHFPLGEYADLAKGYEIIRPATPLERFHSAELKEHIKDAVALICVMSARCDASLIEAGSKLKVIGNVGAGYNNVDVDAATAKGIPVVNTPRAVTDPTAELTIALILACCRAIVRYDRELRAERRWTPLMLPDRDMSLSGKKLGVLGFGRIGRSVAQKADALGMRIIYHDVQQAPAEVEKSLNATYMSADEVLSQADVVTLHMPYTPESHHFINEDRLAKMKPTAYLINAARGSIVSEKALVQALRANVIRGAGLDVHENEPEISEEIASLDNVVVTPHVGTNLADVRMKMMAEALQGVLGVLRGERPYNVVN